MFSEITIDLSSARVGFFHFTSTANRRFMSNASFLYLRIRFYSLGICVLVLFYVVLYVFYLYCKFLMRFSSSFVGMSTSAEEKLGRRSSVRIASTSNGQQHSMVMCMCVH